MAFAVCVTLSIRPGDWDRFIPLMHANAQASLCDEPGCQRFDVLTDPAYPDEVFLYEIYDSAEAFDAHLQPEHFRSFDAAVSEMVQDKVIKTYGEVSQ